MKVLIGYKFIIVDSNDDYNEWWREQHIESPIYLNKEDAVKAIQLVKKARIKAVKDDVKKYIDIQLPYEYKHNRNINRFFVQCQRYYMNQCKIVFEEMAKTKIIPVYAETESSAEFVQFNIAD